MSRVHLPNPNLRDKRFPPGNILQYLQKRTSAWGGQGVRSTGEKDTMLFLGAKWARKSKSEVTLSSKCLVEKLWLLLCFVGKKISPQFFKNFSTALIVLHTFQKKSSAFGPLPLQFSYMITQEWPAGKTSELHFSFSQPFLCPKTTSCP